eukprot:5061802-Prymnesium_polylepis.1
MAVPSDGGRRAQAAGLLSELANRGHQTWSGSAGLRQLMFALVVAIEDAKEPRACVPCSHVCITIVLLMMQCLVPPTPVSVSICSIMVFCARCGRCRASLESVARIATRYGDLL